MGRWGMVCLLVVLSGCLSLADLRSSSRGDRDLRLQQIAYKAADHLHAQLAGSGVAGYPMLAASFVDSSNMDVSSDLGRLVSVQIASRLSQLGYSVAEIQLRADQLAVNPENGVLALSRDLTRINADVEAYSILVGTYTRIERQIYVNTRVVRTSDGVALASSDFSLPVIQQRSSSAGARPSVSTVLR